jgi:Flp pilus assembly protein TadG
MSLTNQRGSSVVELAIAMPFLLLLAVGTLDFGRVFFDTIAVAQAARSGAQYGVQSIEKSADIDGMIAAAEDAAEDIGTVNVAAERVCTCAGGGEVDCTTGTCGVSKPEIYVKVTVDKTFNTLTKYPGVPDGFAVRRRAMLRVD